MRFNKTLLIADADGTLLTDDKRILDADKSAIAELIEGGGMFTIATGRGVSLAKVVVDELGLDLLSTPAVIFNGAVVYDYKKSEFLYKCCLDEKAIDYVEKIMAALPQIGMEILVDGKVYVVSMNEFEQEHIDFGIDADSLIECDYRDVPKAGWIKVLFVDSPQMIDKVIEFTQANPCDCVHMVRSGPSFYEVLPREVNKGTGFRKLIELMDLQGYRVVAAGDYMNDLEMLQQADIAVAAGNAEKVVKDIADVVVCDNNSGVIRNIVEYLKGNVKDGQ